MTVENIKAAAAVRVEVESSEQDDRQYEARTLPNGLSVLLISDPTTEKGAAAMDVRVGHLSDPDEVPGLGHFLEHMLFLGTEKYPDENEYNAFLNQHAGSSNAFTDMESTNYYFDVSAEFLSGALDRFSQFFISPLFNQSATEREINAVDSEHNNNLQNDHWRSFQLSKNLCRHDHPFSKFGSGNLHTLRDMPKEAGIDLREALLSFHERYYSANVMKLVVLGKETVSELGDIVETFFTPIPNKELTPPAFPGTPFGKAELGKRVHVVPVKTEMRQLELSFPMREIESLYKEKPARYISHLIGHEGKGSILSVLRQKGYAFDLAAGESRSCSDWSSFSVTVDLTDEGLVNVDSVTEIVLAYIELLRQSGPQKWVYEETATVAAMSFRFLSKRQPIDYVCSLASSMQIYPQEHILSGPYKIWHYAPGDIDALMSYITVENMIMTVVSKTFDGSTEKTEPWYGTEYSVHDISMALIDKWKHATNESELVGGALSLPELNDMIASDFGIRNVPGFPEDEPRLLMETSTCRCWYKPDNVFSMPKVNVMALLQSPTASESPEASVASSLWVEILNEHATEFTYLAAMASLHCSFSNTRKGIEIHVSGYNHKVHVLVSRILDAIASLAERLDGSLFDRIKDKVEKQFKHFFFAQPYQHAFYGGDLCLEVSKWTVQDKMEALASINKADMVAFSTRLLNRFQLELLVHGNTSREEALAVTSLFIDKLSPSAPFEATLPSLRVVELERGSEYVHRFPEFNDDDTNSCLQSIYQIGPTDLKKNATLAFLHHLIKEPAFNELRTNEQLGYIVHTSIKTSGDNIKGLLFLIQSEGYDPVHLDMRVEAFLHRFRSYVVDMADDKFQANITAVVKTFREKNKNLGEESTKYWAVIANASYLFKKYQIIATAVESLTKEVVLQFFDKYIASAAPDRRKLCVQVYAKQHLNVIDSEVPKGVTLIGPEDITGFKRSSSLFPLPAKVNFEEMKI